MNMGWYPTSIFVITAHQPRPLTHTRVLGSESNHRDKRDGCQEQLRHIGINRMKTIHPIRPLALALALLGSVTLSQRAQATTFTIDSLNGDITSNEINQFVSSINSLTPPVNNW